MSKPPSPDSPFFPIPKLHPLLRSFHIPEPVIHPHPNNPNHQKLQMPPPLDVDLCAPPPRDSIIPVSTLLSLSELAGGTSSEPTTASATSDSPTAFATSNSPTTSKIIVQQPVNDAVVTKVQTEDKQMVNEVMVTKVQSENTHTHRCDVCNIVCNSKDVLNVHQQGKKHLKNLQKLVASISSSAKQEPQPSVVIAAALDCELEKNKMNVDSLQNDICNIINGEKPEARVAIKALLPNPVQLMNNGKHKAEEILKVNQVLWCDVCKVSCGNDKNLEIHNLGKKHLKNVEIVENKKLALPLACLIASEKSTAEDLKSKLTKGETVNPNEAKSVWCEVCAISCSSSVELNNHIVGKKHQKNLKKSEQLCTSVTEKPVEDPMNVEDEVLNLENCKRKDNELIESDENSDGKKQKVMKQEGEASVRLTCSVCHVVCTTVLAFKTHLASQQHSAVVDKLIVYKER